MLFFRRFEWNELVQSDLGTPSRILGNEILVESATHFGPNHKRTDKTQTLFCFHGEKPNQSEADCPDSLFENVESKSSPR